MKVEMEEAFFYNDIDKIKPIMFRLKQCFPTGRFIAEGAPNGDLIRLEFLLSKKNDYVVLTNCKTREDVYVAVIEQAVRPAIKSIWYQTNWRNKKYRRMLADGLAEFFAVDFRDSDLEYIYAKLGNGIRHELTYEFIKNHCSIVWLKQKLGKK